MKLTTLCVDIGGSGIKGMVLDEKGAPLGERTRIPTPRPAKPKAVLQTIAELAATQPAFDRVSVGFPGVVTDGVVMTAPNLDGDWASYPLAAEVERITGRPARAANDADVQGYGAIEGQGVEMVITLGTGMGSALFVDGHLVPNLELAHHVFRKDKTYEQYVGERARKSVGNARWRKRVRDVVNQILPVWNPRLLHLGGGNAARVEGKIDLPENVRVAPNVAGILGGFRLWDDPMAAPHAVVRSNGETAQRTTPADAAPADEPSRADAR